MEYRGAGDNGDEGGERAILVAVDTRRTTLTDTDDPLDELAGLLETAGGEPVSRFRVVRERPDPATFIGRGKVQALGAEVRRTGAELVVFDDELSASQAAQLEKGVGARVIDRSALILDIFARRARTREARTQVELAQLNYLLPRLTRRWTHLGRQTGGIGLRGKGETQLEMDRRMLRRRIGRLRGELRAIDRARGERRKRRRRTFQVALVGYTNAGKTSLFNVMTGASGAEENRLFATLDPMVRPLRGGRRPRTLAIDTVGFVRKLPHGLVASFRSTLREAAQADLLLHVIDPSHPAYERQMETARQVLVELELADTPMIEVFTKVDLVAEPGVLDRAAGLHPGACFVSSKTGEGMEKLLDRVDHELTRDFVEERMLLPVTDTEALARLRREVDVLETVYQDGTVDVRYRVAPEWAAHVRRDMVRPGVR